MNYLNYVKVNFKFLYIAKCFKYLKYLLYDQAINNIPSGYTTLSLYDLAICNEHKEDVKYVTYIKRDELITQYTDFDKYEDGTHRDYYDALEDFRNTYNEYIQNGTKYKNVDIYLPSTKGYRIIVLITISSIIILFICFLLFILYKMRNFTY
ncbi:CYIR protein [Plasmodium cynomolgi strain B]|uniref:CYIR protein n=1 Tax=Plasmodium cynomolgi (strain B) TaxID=1120755 RepID=K6V346_PLACD|nr:CYIR protein [Plasmodium cynomolgi strain B]GAB69760.1 CYIR protein [Plasmodium cynomolgi strain B]